MTETEQQLFIEVTELRRKVAEQESALRRAEAAMRCMDQIGLLLANQGGPWPDVVFER